MDTQLTISNRFRNICALLTLIGLVCLAVGFITAPSRAWATVLLGNYYFLSLSIGAAFFLALQYITQSGWSSLFKRIPEAMGFYLPVAGVIMLLLYFGIQHLYPWSLPNANATDELVRHKSAYLNIPFFLLRIIIFFIAWTVMNTILRRLSLMEDKEGGMYYFEKSEYYSKVYIFIIAITFSLASFDWIMSVDVHWFSTIFAFKNFASAFYHASAVIALIVILLNERGYFPQLNESHLVDFSRYLFMLAIIWGYLWFSQFMLIWYGNLPEETVYYARQFRSGFSFLFYLNVIINWFLPFILLMAKRMDRKRSVVKWVSIMLVAGFWIDLYMQIYPGTIGSPKFGLIEIGVWLGFAGVFAWITIRALTKASLIPVNHPYLDESVNHYLEQ